MVDKTENPKVMLKNVRLSYPALFTTGTYKGTPTNKYEGTFLLDKEKHKTTIATIQQLINQAIKNELKGAKLGADKICLRDGDETDKDGYEGCMFVKATNFDRPLLLDNDKEELTEDNGRFYSGAYVNAQIDLRVQNNKWGKRVNAKLLAVQFYKKGEPLSGGTRADVEDFEMCGSDDEESSGSNPFDD